MKPTFVTIADEAFRESVLLSVRQAHRLYPESEFLVYDFGLSESGRAELAAEVSVTEIVDWDPALRTVPTAWVRDLGRSVKHSLGDLAARLFGNGRTSERYPAIGPGRETLYAQKPYLLRDALRRTGAQLVYLDGDAFLVDRIDEIFKGKFDVGVTVRRPHEISLERNHCQALNAGVLFFTGPPDVTSSFLRAWIRRMHRTFEYLVEQTALTRLIDDHNPGIFTSGGVDGTVRTGDIEVAVRALPCDRYNFNWIEEGVDPERNRIVHFKGARHRPERFRKLLRGLELPNLRTETGNRGGT